MKKPESPHNLLSLAICSLAVIVIISQSAFSDILLIVNSKNEAYTFDTVTGEKTPIKYDALYIDGRKPSPPGDGPEDPDVPDSTGYANVVKGLAKKIDDSIGNALYSEGVYRTLEKEMSKGSIPADADSVDSAITKAIETATSFYPGEKKKEWAEFNSTVINELSKRLIAKGGNLTKADYVKFFGEVAEGLEAANEGNAIPDWLKPIIAEIIKIIIRLIQDQFTYYQQLEEVIFEIAVGTGLV